jgi:ferredoxin
MDHASCVLSPKSLLFPQSQVMFESSLDESCEDHHILKPVPWDATPRAIIGIKPFDARAVCLVNLNFDTDEYRDPYWCDALDITTFIGLAVNNPSRVDFSTTAGSGPFGEEGLDVLLVDCENHYLAKILTSKGDEFLKEAGFKIDKQDKEIDQKTANDTLQKMKETAEAAIGSSIHTDRLRKQTILDLHGASFWDELAFSCINCGTCTFVCPTCWCFDIQDETRGKLAQRIRNWDTCMSPLFTRHGSGHNPRGEKTQRVKQRFMHKLKYFLDKYDQGIMCVGCGRCVESCPVNIDIREVCNQMNCEPLTQSDLIEQA